MAMYQKMPTMPIPSKDKLRKSKYRRQRLKPKTNQNIDYKQTFHSRIRNNYSSESSDDSHDSISSSSILQTCQTQKHAHRRNHKHIQMDMENIAQSTTDELSPNQSVASIFSDTRPRFAISRRVCKQTPSNNTCTDKYLCANCKTHLRNKEVWRCSKCKSSFYCGRKCQLTHWRTHKMECAKTITIKIATVERVGVADWNHYAIIYWFNRVISNDVKYTELRRHIVVGKIKGFELMSINNITLRMMGIHNTNKQQSILNAIHGVLKDNFDNLSANRMNRDIPMKYVDPVLYELMEQPVKVRQSGYVYNKSFITQYIEENKSDPITQQIADLSDIIQCKALRVEIENWKLNI